MNIIINNKRIPYLLKKIKTTKKNKNVKLIFCIFILARQFKQINYSKGKLKCKVR